MAGRPRGRSRGAGSELASLEDVRKWGLSDVCVWCAGTLGRQAPLDSWFRLFNDQNVLGEDLLSMSAARVHELVEPYYNLHDRVEPFLKAQAALLQNRGAAKAHPPKELAADVMAWSMSDVCLWFASLLKRSPVCLEGWCHLVIDQEWTGQTLLSVQPLDVYRRAKEYYGTGEGEMDSVIEALKGLRGEGRGRVLSFTDKLLKRGGAAGPPSRSVGSWSVEDACRWLAKAVPLPKKETLAVWQLLFHENQITGLALLQLDAGRLHGLAHDFYALADDVPVLTAAITHLAASSS